MTSDREAARINSGEAIGFCLGKRQRNSWARGCWGWEWEAILWIPRVTRAGDGGGWEDWRMEDGWEGWEREGRRDGMRRWRGAFVGSV